MMICAKLNLVSGVFDMFWCVVVSSPLSLV